MEPSIDDAGDFYVGGRDTSKLTSDINGLSTEMKAH